MLYVSGTGSGKSLIFLLPAFVESGQKTTVVVVPLVALMEDMKRRCRKHKLSYDVWQGKHCC